MKRREFLASSAMAAAVAVSARIGRGADEQPNRQFIEVRTYHFANPDKQQAYQTFLAQVAIPAWNRAGIEPAGAFKFVPADNPKVKIDPNDLFVVLPHKSAESLATLEAKLAADAQYQQAGKAIITAPKSDPAYTRYESSLLLAFTGFPQVQVPSKAPTRVAQFRIYEAHTKHGNLQKVDMFNKGEIAIFKECGMNGVFYGEALAGSNLPNVTYMLSFDDPDALKKGWQAFGRNPNWKKISKDPTYGDAEPFRITNILLRPIEGSQI